MIHRAGLRTPTPLRDMALIHVVLATGARPLEVARLEIADYLEPGGAVRACSVMRAAVSVNRNQDMVSRVVGSPGVILVSEGPTNRVVPLLANERKRTARWLPEVPIYEIQVGNDEGQVPLLKLQKSLSRLPRNLRGGEITEVRRRLDALGNAANSLPIPKGPMPTSTRQVRRQR